MAGTEDERDGIELGTPGASARAHYEWLRRRDDVRGRQKFGRLAPVAAFLAGPKRSTEAWEVGAEGEIRIGALLSQVVGSRGVVLHDRRIPGSRANLDHIAIVPSGVWVIDSKHYHGRLEHRSVGGWFTPREALYVGRRDCSSLVASAIRQRADVASRIPPGVPVRAALCFAGVDLPLLVRPFALEGVLVSWPKALPKTIVASGPLDTATRHELALTLAHAFPPYSGGRSASPG